MTGKEETSTRGRGGIGDQAHFVALPAETEQPVKQKNLSEEARNCVQNVEMYLREK